MDGRGRSVWKDRFCFWGLFLVKMSLSTANSNLCSVCAQPIACCGGRSNRRAGTVDIMMMPGFRDGVTVPCCFKVLLDSLVKNWLVAKCPRGYKYDLFVKKDETQSFICGPYWRLLVSSYNINTYDIVSFFFNPEDLEVPDEYELDVCDINEKPNKWAVKTGEGFSCNHVLSMNRETLHKVVFSNITDISDVEMREFNWVLVKEWKFYYNLCKDEDFFDLDQFFVHRMKEDDLNFLAIPGEIAQGYHLRCEDTALLCSEEFDYYLYGSYSYHKGQDIIIKDRWAQFCAELGIEAGSLIMVLIEMRELCIRVDVTVLNR